MLLAPYTSSNNWRDLVPDKKFLESLMQLVNKLNNKVFTDRLLLYYENNKSYFTVELLIAIKRDKNTNIVSKIKNVIKEPHLQCIIS